MAGFPGAWFVCGGWAIDLFLRRVTRDHADVEIGVYRDELKGLWEYFPGRRLEKVVQREGKGEWQPWQGELLQLPVHQVRILDLSAKLPVLEFLIHERREGEWICRRHPEVVRPLEGVWRRTFSGIPFLVPEIQLLFKAKQTRAKDQEDFENTVPRLGGEGKGWLGQVLRRFYPGHPWTTALQVAQTDLQ